MVFKNTAIVTVEAGGKIISNGTGITFTDDLQVYGEFIFNDGTLTTWSPVVVTGSFVVNNSSATFNDAVTITVGGSSNGNFTFNTKPAFTFTYFKEPITVNNAVLSFIDNDIETDDIILVNDAELNVENTKLDLTGFSSVSSDSRLNISDQCCPK